MSESGKLIQQRVLNALRAAPMPIRESILQDDAWHEAYDQWWHEFASEAGIAALLREESMDPTEER